MKLVDEIIRLSAPMRETAEAVQALVSNVESIAKGLVIIAKNQAVQQRAIEHLLAVVDESRDRASQPSLTTTKKAKPN